MADHIVTQNASHTTSHVQTLSSRAAQSNDPGMQDDDLLEFARIRGGQRFHQLIKPDRLANLPFQKFLILITTLLTTKAKSDGMHLYKWYRDQIQSDSERTILDDTVFKAQEEKLDGGFESEQGQAFLASLARSSKRKSSSTFEPFINRISIETLKQFILPLTGSLSYHYLPDEEEEKACPREQLTYTIQKIRDPDLQLGLLVWGNTLPYGSQWFNLFLTADRRYAETLIRYMRQLNLHPADFIHNTLCIHPSNPFYKAHFAKPLFDLLNEHERVELLQASLGWATCCEPQSLSFGSFRAILHRHTSQTATSRSSDPFLCPGRVLNLNLPTDISQTTKALARELLRYEFYRTINRNEYFRFMGIASTDGYSRTEKLAVVNKLLLQIYGNQADRDQAGPFTDHERAVLYQGKLGNIAERYRTTIEPLITTTDNTLQNNESNFSTP